MGTTYTVKVAPGASPSLATRIAELEGRVRQALDEVDRLMSTFRPDSELSRFNRAPANVPVALSPDTIEVFSLALEVHRESGGAFDVTVGPLVEAWGFGPERHRRPPAADALQELRDRVGSHLLQLDPAAGTLTKIREGVECDLSAVAKGYAADRVATALAAAGVDRYMVELGGEVRVHGLNRNDRPWQIGVERPLPGQRGVQRILPLTEGGLATSGDYRNFYEIGGRRYSHALDPRTGAPVTHSLASVSVLAADCATADAWATALLVLGPDEGYRLAEERNIRAFFLVHDNDTGVVVLATTALERDLDDGSPAATPREP